MTQPQPQNAVSLRELAFVRDVLIPRTWVRGAEVDELVRLRLTIERIFRSLEEAPAPDPPEEDDSR